MKNIHTPVMVSEVLQYLSVKKDCWYIDATLGGGGHTEKILQKGGRVLGIDLDQDVIDEVTKKLHAEIQSGNLIVKQGNFANLKQILDSINYKTCPCQNASHFASDLPRLPQLDLNYNCGFARSDGILFDLGISSNQLNITERGFSFNRDAPLDMRMDPKNISVTAADLVGGLHEGELVDLFWKLGEEKFAKKIAHKIVEVRKNNSIKTTKQLTDLVISVKPRKAHDKIHPATQVFQALRIAVNDELNNLKTALPQALDVLAKNGSLVVISFHSLEDRIVKNFCRDQEKIGNVRILTKKPITPCDNEILENPRSRSAKMRVLEKLV